MTRLVLMGTVHRDPDGKKRLHGVFESIRPDAISLEVSPASVRLRTRWRRNWMRLFRRRLDGLSLDTGLPKARLIAGAGLRGLFEYLRLPYEYRAALAYGRHHQCPVFLLDDSHLASAYLSQVEEEILTESNIRLLHETAGADGLEDDVAAGYARAQALVFPQQPDEPSTAPWLKDPEAWARREADLSQKLRLLHQGLIRKQGRTMPGGDLVAGLIIAPEAVAFVPDTVTLRPDLAHLYVGGWEHLVETESRDSLYSRLKDLDPERALCVNHGPGN